MGIHGDDVVRTIREALVEHETCLTLGGIRATPNPARLWSERDGVLQFDAIGRDWFRAFRITVEAMSPEDYSDSGGSEAWTVVNRSEYETISEDVMVLLAGLGVDSVSDLRRIVESYRLLEDMTAEVRGVISDLALGIDGDA